LRARIVFQADSRDEAEAMASALSPDNRKVPPGMKISTTSRGSNVVTKIEFSGRIQTLMVTIDDLLKCAQAAEQSLKSVSQTST
jgi:hypothetical protein